jgi:hypothetical protein
VAIADYLNPLRWLNDWRTARKTKLEIAKLKAEAAEHERAEFLTTSVSIKDIEKYDPKISQILRRLRSYRPEANASLAFAAVAIALGSLAVIVARYSGTTFWVINTVVGIIAAMLLIRAWMR